MPKNGNRPMPTKLKVFRGETRPSQLNKNEPTLPPCLPAAPEELNEDSLKVWNNLAPQLDELGILTAIDQTMLGFLCQEIARFRKYMKLLDESTPLIKDRDNGLRKNPMAQLCRDSLLLINRIGGDFGLSPVARARLTVADPHDGDELEALLRD